MNTTRYLYIVFSLLAVTIFISAFLTRKFSQPNSSFFIVDQPNERSLHGEPVPRAGGVAIMTTCLFMGTVAVLYYGLPEGFVWLFLGAFLVALVSFFDDRRGLGPGYRLLAHMAAAVLIILGGYRLFDLALPGIAWGLSQELGWLFSILVVVWLINLFNFMDGMDGFAAGMAVFGFSTYGLLGFQQGHPLFAVLCWIIASATAGFLIWNFPPARIFMGDIGSSTLGYLVAGFSIWAARENIFPLWAAVIIFSPFIVDASLTLFLRLFRKEKVWEAHKNHYYQRLVQLGWGHKRTVIWEYALMLFCCASAWLAIRVSTAYQWAILVSWTIVYILLIVFIHRLEARYRMIDK